MNEQKLKKAVAGALADFFGSERGQQLLGDIVISAVVQGLTLEVQYEDGRSDPGRVVERTEQWDMRKWIFDYMPRVEAAMRGCQADAGKARNRSREALDQTRELLEKVDAIGQLYLTLERPLKNLALLSDAIQARPVLSSDRTILIEEH